MSQMLNDKKPMWSFTCSAGQDFRTTESLGISNPSLQLLRHLTHHPKQEGFTVPTNSTLLAREQMVQYLIGQKVEPV